MTINQTMKDRNTTNGAKPPNENERPASSPGATHVGERENRPSPSIHEDVIARYQTRNARTREIEYDSVILRMTNAVGNARLAAERAQRVSEAIFANEMQTMPARHRQVKEKCWRIVQPVLGDIDSAMASCKRELESLEEKTSAPARPTDSSGYFLASEVRQRLASMNEIDREAALSQALSEDDDAALGAVLAASPMLSGISKARHQMLRGAWQKKRFAPEIERMERLKKALAETERAGTLTLAYTLSLSSEEIVRRAEASERAVQEALDS